MIRIAFFLSCLLALFINTNSFAVCPTNPQCIVFQQQYIPGTITYSAYPLDVSSCGEPILGSYVFNNPAGTWGNLTVKLFYWNGSSWTNYSIYTPRTLLDNYNTVYAKLKSLGTEVPYDQTVSEVLSNGCPNPCTEKAGQVNYNLVNHNIGETFSAQNSCLDNCQQTTQALWEDCINDSCVTSVKYTYTGQTCTDEPGLTNVTPTPPTRCTEQLSDLIAQCGGSLNVQSFDFETCTGSCTPDSCQAEWAALTARCGGIMGISSWNKTTCTGTCASDPVPQPPTAEEKPPENIEETTKTNTDGSKEVTKTSTQYNSTDHTTYTNNTTTYYDAFGNQTGTSTTVTRSAGDESQTVENFSSITPSGFDTPYQPGNGQYDIPGRFSSFFNNVKSSGLFSFSSGFFNSLPGGGTAVYEINGGQTFGSHSVDLSQTMSIGLAVLKTILLACFGFLSIRTVIMKR